MPAARRRNDAVDLRWAPAILLVLIDRGRRFQDGIDDPPRLVDIIRACKEGRVPLNSVAEDAFIRIVFTGYGPPASKQFDRLANQFLPRSHDHHTKGEGNLGADPEP